MVSIDDHTLFMALKMTAYNFNAPLDNSYTAVVTLYTGTSSMGST